MLRKRYEVTKKVRKVAKRLRNELRETMVTKIPSYEIVYEKGTNRLQRGCEISYERPWLRRYQVTK